MKLKLIIRKSNKKNRTEAATTIHICNGYSQARYLFQLTATMILRRKITIKETKWRGYLDHLKP
jgi:hypothetical protein